MVQVQQVFIEAIFGSVAAFEAQVAAFRQALAAHALTEGVAAPTASHELVARVAAREPYEVVPKPEQ